MEQVAQALGRVSPRPQPVDGMPPQDQVTLAFRAVLRREPDEGGLATYTEALRGGRDLAWLVTQLSQSDEFRSLPGRLRPDLRFPLDSAPRLDIRSTLGPAEQQALWDQVAQVWSGLGEADPHWSVLTEDRYRRTALDAAALAVFRESGVGEVHRLNAWLRRAEWVLPPDAVCAEYGCGVGRITAPLARQFGRVIGFDVSPPHLAEARAALAAEQISNVSFVPVRGPADLAALDGIDLFYSVISLQHSPPPIIEAVLTRAFHGLRPRGCAFFQVPTYAAGYNYDLHRTAPTGEMEMHVLPQRRILQMAHEAGLVAAEIQPDWCVGRPGEWISSTFLLLRPT